jgi:hypothetical protein
LQSKAEQQGTELAMTVYTAPPNQNGLVVGNGDFLQVNSGGTVTNTSVTSNGEVFVAGGTAVNTTLDGGKEIVQSGIANGVTFDGNGAVLSATDPASIQGTLTFDVERGGQVEYNIDFGTAITSIASTSSTLTLNYGTKQSITYDYHSAGGNGFVTFSQSGDDIVRVLVNSLSETTGHSQPGFSGHFHPEPLKFSDARIGDLNHDSTPVIGLLHHLNGEFHL